MRGPGAPSSCRRVARRPPTDATTPPAQPCSGMSSRAALKNGSPAKNQLLAVMQEDTVVETAKETFSLQNDPPSRDMIMISLTCIPHCGQLTV